ncbi:hypothetical protein OMO38_10250 [Chryseobacterium sp. 09-1422]|uniref:LysM domain-containing protein n=1 Tax=Chryseobacterium kimseyorum TaxID=2984028 RepID=A0ABT3HYM3_9FLAO|nr:hypothetical protein [Chryseobacterium kimseyorum]MCW3168902.1 hypothetical protein [Chryseobacterium kimseyorum]
MEIIVLNRQSLQDLAVQHTGSVFNAFSIALANDLSVSESVAPGTVLKLPDVSKNTDILNYYGAKKIKPATELQDLRPVEETRGIGWMKVGNTFKVL